MRGSELQNTTKLTAEQGIPNSTARVSGCICLVHGVILSRGMHISTFLPQVWEQLPDKELFLEHLCLKGGMPATVWKDPATNVEVCQAKVFGEKGNHSRKNVGDYGFCAVTVMR
ncbi:MAG: AMMECR1 domain-containing protein [Deltaproteobacteria bacterium]|nr:AMMECR1 domain-containing protein [Deltaproteobacteria bacterium]